MSASKFIQRIKGQIRRSNIFLMNQSFGQLIKLNFIYKQFMPFFKLYLPIISFGIGISALSFQTLVLHPWHNRLDDEFRSLKQLKAEIDRQLYSFDQKKMDRIIQLDSKIDRLIKRREEFNRKVLMQVSNFHNKIVE